ncbi:SNF2 family n-terminal domain-containing protein [Fusarium heterosporum]|uniref:SNF2 family n-terminal domain-containing protein n=1 Tax=Fusarium heterosporum TaxID=42747 RepID=A0A8H5TQW7_FUSHE|nr:SNF2 family n-terminal domain-containing protein [Fusarium heterosporum]
MALLHMKSKLSGDQVAKLQAMFKISDGSLRAQIPGFRAKLFAHQTVAIYKIITTVQGSRIGTFLSDLMGLGKTITSLALVAVVTLGRLIQTHIVANAASHNGPNDAEGSPYPGNLDFGLQCLCVTTNPLKDFMLRVAKDAPIGVFVPTDLVQDWADKIEENIDPILSRAGQPLDGCDFLHAFKHDKDDVFLPVNQTKKSLTWEELLPACQSTGTFSDVPAKVLFLTGTPIPTRPASSAFAFKLLSDDIRVAERVFDMARPLLQDGAQKAAFGGDGDDGGGGADGQAVSAVAGFAEMIAPYFIARGYGTEIADGERIPDDRPPYSSCEVRFSIPPESADKHRAWVGACKTEVEAQVRRESTPKAKRKGKKGNGKGKSIDGTGDGGMGKINIMTFQFGQLNLFNRLYRGAHCIPLLERWEIDGPKDAEAVAFPYTAMEVKKDLALKDNSMIREEVAKAGSDKMFQFIERLLADAQRGEHTYHEANPPSLDRPMHAVIITASPINAAFVSDRANMFDEFGEEIQRQIKDGAVLKTFVIVTTYPVISNGFDNLGWVDIMVFMGEPFTATYITQAQGRLWRPGHGRPIALYRLRNGRHDRVVFERNGLVKDLNVEVAGAPEPIDENDVNA